MAATTEGLEVGSIVSAAVALGDDVIDLTGGHDPALQTAVTTERFFIENLLSQSLPGHTVAARSRALTLR
jgi:hypothetical protein